MVTQLMVTKLRRCFLKNLRSLIVIVQSIIVLTLFPGITKADWPGGDITSDELQHKLGQITLECCDEGNLKIEEAKLLELLNEFHKPEEKGRIYVTLAIILGSHGLDRQKVIDYCQEALKYPLDPLNACLMYNDLGNYRGGLNLVNKYLKITKKQKEPLVVRCDPHDPNSHVYKEYQASLKANREAHFQNALLVWHDRFLKNIEHGH